MKGLEMKIVALFTIIGSVAFSATSFASETSYFYCTSQTEFAAVKVTQVTESNNGQVSSTFKLDVWDLNSQKTEYWQVGNIQFGSDDTFRGSFEKTGEIPIEANIKAPTFPDFKPRESFIVQGADKYLLDCNSL